MPTEFRYAAYPDAKVFDAAGNQIKHLLWGDWVQVKGPKRSGKFPVRVRGADGFMFEDDLQEERLLEVVFVDVGQGDGCLLITPDDKKFIIDAGISDNMYRFLNWRFNFRGGVRTFDAAIITHPDADHYKGFKQLFSEPGIKFKRIYHNGIMEQKGKPFGPERTVGRVKYITELMETKSDLESFLSDPSRYGRKLYANLLKDGLKRLTSGGDVRMLAASGDPGQPNYVEGFGATKKLRMKVLGPIPEPDSSGKNRLRWFRDRPDGGSNSTSKTKNGQSVILMVEYGDISVMLGGDLNSSAEAFLMEQYTGLPWPPGDSSEDKILIDAARKQFEADITKCCHHGSADFTDTFLQAVNSAATVVSSGDEESHAHPRCDTLGAIGLHGRGWRPLILSTELARSSREDEGNMREEFSNLLEEIESETDAQRREELIEQREDLLNSLTRRNVTTYGAINLRTDGEKAVLAYRLERAREGGRRGGPKTITRWDLYRMERLGNGPLVYVPGTGH